MCEMKRNDTTVFVILHYVTVQNTISEVEHIFKDLNGCKKIIIVDNGSPNNSGKILATKYKLNPFVQVILNSQNEGFAKGMNLGYKNARAFKPEFIVLLNNDIEFTQKNFLNLIEESYEENKFAILGPDIIVPETNVHQNPKQKRAYTVNEVRKINSQNKKILRLPPLFFNLRAQIKQVKKIRKIVRLFRKQNIKYEKKVLKNVVLHGSFLVFSKKFIEIKSSVFDPNTFFYFETEILDKNVREMGLLSVYDPRIKVLHHQSSSTKATFKNLVQRQRFQVENMIKSTTVFLNKFEGTNK